MRCLADRDRQSWRHEELAAGEKLAIYFFGFE
jgi:hypothetical protein